MKGNANIIEGFLKWDEIVEALDDDRALAIGDELDRWGWPAELGEKPESKDEEEWIRRTVRGLVESKCSKKAVLRYHHTHNLGRTEPQFEDWWATSGAWWIDSRAREELESIVKRAVERALIASKKPFGEQPQKDTEECAEKRTDHRGKQFIAAIPLLLCLIFGAFLLVLLKSF